uniref:ULP_PROTEASE domain-containing protein n=1 Tax=Parastrongyloides trichosuri TaxID=131310 RepID=A0A0N4ZP50_PARTI
MVKTFYKTQEILQLVKNNDNVLYEKIKDYYFTINTREIFINGHQIDLSSNILVSKDRFLFFAKEQGTNIPFVKCFSKHCFSKIQLLDVKENKGGALILWTSIKYIVKFMGAYLNLKDLRIFNKDSKVIIVTSLGWKHKYKYDKIIDGLTAFGQTIPVEYIKFAALEKCISKFNLKAFVYTYNEAGLLIILMKKIHLNFKSFDILEDFISKHEKDENYSIYNQFRRIKRRSHFTKSYDLKLYSSRNMETDENYEVFGNALISLFDMRWLHGDILETYFNLWRKRIYEKISSSRNEMFQMIKIYDTFFYTRLIHGVKFENVKGVNVPAFETLKKNASKIAKQKVYRSPKNHLTIFDFDLIIVPVHMNDHWLTGIIFKPRNCLFRKEENEKVNDGNYAYVFIYDSLMNECLSDRASTTSVLKEFIGACHEALKTESPYYGMLFDKGKIKTIKIKNPIQQTNGYDCGLYSLEFIRQIILNPSSIDRLIKKENMGDIFPDFDVMDKRNYLKSLVYSQIDKKDWLYWQEVEALYDYEYFRKKVVQGRSRSAERRVTNGIRRRTKSCTIEHFNLSESTYSNNNNECPILSKRVKLL